MAYPYYGGQQMPAPQPQPVIQPITGPSTYGYVPQPPQGQLEQLRAAQAYQAQAAAQAQAQASQGPQMGFQWVQGEAGAKAYLVAPGASVLLMDSEGQSFYIKAADGTGMPLPLRIFDYQERQQVQPQASPQVAQQAPQQAAQAAPTQPVAYVTRDELTALLSRLEELERAKQAPAAKAEEPAIEKNEKGGSTHGKRAISAAQ